MWLGIGALVGAAAGDAETIEIGAVLRTLALPVPAALLDALRTEDWDQATILSRAVPRADDPRAQQAWAFLAGWSAVHDGQAASATDLLPLLDPLNAAGGWVPEAYASYVIGEIALANGDAARALSAFDAVSAGYRPTLAPLAALRAADALTALGRSEDARARLQAAAANPDRSESFAKVLVRLGEIDPGPDGTAFLRRVWMEFPGSDADRAASALLAKRGSTPTWQERAVRAERWTDLQDWAAALAETDPIAAEAKGTTLDACRLRFVRGRSLYKRNRITEAATTFANIGPDCANVQADYGPRGLYLLATAQYRRKLYAESADAYRQLVTYYRSHSMADDALTRGGIALLEGGQPGVAQTWWEEALRDFPAGDTVPEAQLRLALHRYLNGDGAVAMGIAQRLGALPYETDPVNVAAGRYWAARWRLFGQAVAPDSPSTDPAAKADAVTGWKTLCEQLPHSYYAILAHARLTEVAPDVAAALRRRSPSSAVSGGSWHVRAALFTDPHVRDGILLARLGLSNEARAEWAASVLSEWTPDERAWLSELRIAAGDWLGAHDELNRWLGKHPIGTLGPHEADIIRLAYPDRYWDDVRTAVQPAYRFEPRLFHALVREESNFDAGIISFAGARGLSQLMPSTAKQTAGWLGITVTDRELSIPSTNLKIGARYLDALLGQLDGSPYLALAAYNGGAANVTKWAEEDGNPPTDEFVEQIPFEETRGYVKRVMGSWQTMRSRFDADRDVFVDLSAYNHRALIGR